MPTALDPRLADVQLLRLAALRLKHRREQAGPPAWHGQVRGQMRTLHPKQAAFITSPAKRKVIRAGRRSGKTVGVSQMAVEDFLQGRRVLYAVPTQEQVDRFWYEVKAALEPAVDAGLVYKNETRHVLALPRTETRIKAKTAFNADTLRGDYADKLILDEWQLCNEDAWGVVGAPMLLDNDGDAVFVYTPPSFRTAGLSKAHDRRHAAKLYAMAADDTSGRWQAWTFTSHDNPYISTAALSEIARDMSALSYRQEILAEDIDTVPGALWTHVLLDQHRVLKAPALQQVVVGIDPGGDAGIVAVGLGEDGQGYVLQDASISGSPTVWASEAVATYHKLRANKLVVERNHGGDMVETTIRTIDPTVVVETVWASQGKYARAEPVSTLYEQGRVHHVGLFAALEDECCNWVPGEGMPSPNRLDALVWACTALMLKQQNVLPDLDFSATLDGLAQASAWR